MRPLPETAPVGCPATDLDHTAFQALTTLRRCLPPQAAVSLAVVREDAHALQAHGRAAGAAVTPDTAFEIGSVSKTFTALLLAEAIARGELHYRDPIDALLPPQHRPVLSHGERITLLHLATHTSGLPRLPPGLLRSALPRWTSNPYEAFTREDLLTALRRTTVRSRPGSRLRYSNFGVGLLGHLLADAAGFQYPGLLADRICAPLGLRGTSCEPNPRSQAVGHAHGRELPPWQIPGLPGAGAIRSTGRDLALLLRAYLTAAADPHPNGIPLRTALRDVQRPRVATRRGGDQMGLVWNIRRIGESDLLFHSGATRGFTAFIGFSPQAGAGLAALTDRAPTLDGRFIQTAYGQLRALMNSSQ